MLTRILKAHASALMPLALILVMVCGLSACGQKGPLVPAAEAPSTPTPDAA